MVYGYHAQRQDAWRGPLLAAFLVCGTKHRSFPLHRSSPPSYLPILWGVGFKVECSALSVQALSSDGVYGLRFMVYDLKFMVDGLWFMV